MGDVVELPAAADSLQRHKMIVLIVDVVESVLLMERDEDDVVRRWLEFLRSAQMLVTNHGGKLRKKTGDGLVAQFPSAPAAVRCALALEEAKASENEHASQSILIRGVVDEVRVIDVGDDIYGRDVNRAFRLLSLAHAGCTVVSAAIRDNLIDTVDAHFEDLGERFVRHVPEPQRVYRVTSSESFESHAIPADNTAPMISEDALMPTLAVVPPTVATDLRWPGLGEILAEQMIGQLASSREIRVISRLSTSPLTDRQMTGEQIGQHLDADYVVTGHITSRGAGDGIILSIELANLADGTVDWREELRAQASEIVSPSNGLVGDLTSRLAREVRRREVDLVRTRPLQTLHHHTLLLGAVTLMHRLSYHDFMRAETALKALVDRAGRQALPLAWLAKWHAFRVQQGWSPDPARDAAAGQDATNRALDADPECILALVMDGFVKTNLLRQLDNAQASYDRAIELCPNEPLARLLRGTLHAFKGEGEIAVAETVRALELTPLDPHRFFYTSLAATARLAAEDYDGAIRLGRQSLRLNKMHSSTLRALGIAHWLRGDGEEAITYGNAMRALEPDLTVSQWRNRTPAAGFATAELWADGLRGMGIPE